MKRRLFKLVVFLLLGAVVNVGVAWGFAAWIESGQGHKSFGSSTTSGVVWSVFVYRRAGAVRAESLRWRLPVGVKGEYQGPSASDVAPYWGGLATPTAAFLTQTGGDQRRLEGRGWPAIALWYLVDETEEPDLVSRQWPIHGGFPAGMYLIPEERPWFHPPRPLPLRPASRGFAINTIFYAGILWLPFAPFQLRRYIRVKRGRCIKCGYDLRGAFSSGCPECGWQREESSSRTGE